MSENYAVEVVQLSKSYKQTKVLDNLSFKCRKGELLCLVGSSGAGKSTLIHLLAGLDRPDAGKIRQFGTDISKLSAKESAKYRNTKLGIVFQSFCLIPYLSAVDNVSVPMLISGFSAKQARLKSFELLGSLGLADKAANKPYQLSGGQQQRVAIARALANDPPIILADEPTGNLDDKNAAVIGDIFKRLANEGRTVIVASHDQSMISICDQHIYLED